ncbi:MAG: glycoside hydrolase family 18 protein [Acidobacteriota bacterium]
MPYAQRPPGRRPRRGTTTAVLAAALVLAMLVLAGCSKSWSRRQKTSASALWLGSSSAELTTSNLARLKDAGVEEAYLPVARLEPGGGDGPLSALELPPSLPEMPINLAIQGRWSIESEERAQGLAKRVARALRQTRFDIESQGGLVVGIHVDITKVDDFKTYTVFLKELRKALEDDVFLSATVQRTWLDKDETPALAQAVDYVVAFVYGQRINEKETGDAWDFTELERYLQTLEGFGTPYQIGVVTLGTATHLSPKGGVKARITRTSLQEILWNRSLKLRPGFTLEGVNRRVYAVVAERTTSLGDWRIAPGDQVRVVRAATSDLEEMLRLVDVWDLPNHLGQVYYRLPNAEEMLSIHSDSLLNALAAESAQPDLTFEVSVQRRTGRGWLVRFGIQNQNREFTELALLDNNYIQVTAANDGVFSTNDVDTGEFYRYDLYRPGPGGEPERTFRRPSILRLYVPLLEGQQRVASDDIEVVVRGEPVFDIQAKFLLTDGRTLEIPSQRWRGGERQP